MTRKFILSLAILLLGISSIYSQSIKKGPYMIYPNNNTQMQILWQLSSTATCTIEWGETTAYGSSQSVSEYGSDHQFKYTITGLTTGTKYYYKVSWGSNTLTNSFLTAPEASATAVKFLAYGDTRTYYDKTNLVTGRMLSEISSDADYQTFSLHTGDWVNKGQNASADEWGDQFFNRDVNGTNNIIFQSKVPLMGVRGNHENYIVNYSPYEAASLFYKYFPYDLATTPSEPGDDMYYSFDYGPVHIVVLDQYDNGSYGNDYGTGDPDVAISSAQKTWLENDLANSDKPWKFILLHEPGWSASSTSKSEHGNNTDVQNNIQPICLQYGVQAVFGGHNHYYAHCLVNGVHHFTLGGGGAPLYAPSYTSGGVIVKSEETYHFMKVDVNGNNATLTVERPDGTTVETINLTIPVINPTNFVATPTSTSQIDLSWTQNSDNNDILLAFNTSNTFGTPTGTYNVGDNITGGGEVIALGDIESFNHTSLSAQTYYYKIWSKNGTEYSNGITTNASPIIGEPTNHVTSFTAGSPTASSITLTWVDATGATTPAGYLIKAVATGGTITNPTDGIPENDGIFTKNVAQGTQNIIFNNLNPLTSYDFKIFPYSNSGTSIDYKIDGTVPTASETTVDMPSECGNETFDNLTTGSTSYSTVTFGGQDGSTWTSTQTRTDQNLGNGAAVCIKGSSSGYLESGTITNGISKITISTIRAFSGDIGTVSVKVNGSVVGIVPYGASLQTSSINNIDISGDITLRFEPSGDRVIIDDIVWECFGGGSSNDATSTVTAPSTQILANTITSAQTDCNNPVDVFAFDIVDDGATDGNQTIITNIRLKPGATNTADWTDHIQNVKVNNGSGYITSGAVVITDNYIDIPISAGNFNIGDGHSGTATIAICLNNSGLVNNSILSFKVDATNHGFAADASGSQFANTFTSDVTSNNFTIEVLCMEPTTNSSDINFSNLTQTSVDLNWTAGNGANRIIIAKEGSDVDAIPVNNTSYTANTTFGLGDEIGTGNFVVYNGHSNSVSIAGLNENKNYFFKIFEFNCSTGEENYLTSGTIGSGNISTPTTIDVLNSEFKIYPNPSNGNFTIISDKKEITKIRIADMTGKIILEKNIKSRKSNIDISTFSKGIYFIEIITKDKHIRRKILKK